MVGTRPSVTAADRCVQLCTQWIQRIPGEGSYGYPSCDLNIPRAILKMFSKII